MYLGLGLFSLKYFLYSLIYLVNISMLKLSNTILIYFNYLFWRVAQICLKSLHKIFGVRCTLPFLTFGEMAKFLFIKQTFF